MGENVVLAQLIADARLTQEELAQAVNLKIQELTGAPGTVTDRTVRNWLTGARSWPQERFRLALGAVFGCAIEDLGFSRPPGARSAPPAGREDPMRRRTVLSAGLGVAAAAAKPGSARLATVQRIGSADVQQLVERFGMIISSDHQVGGRRSIENRALALADEALRLQASGGASQRIRNQLYGCAAAAVSSAMWAAIDGRRYADAQRHQQRAISLAGMSHDPAIQFRIWSHTGSMYRHMGEPAEAIQANDAARELSITRRDPMFASLGHARHAAILGLTGDVNGMRRVIDRAEDALSRADPDASRPGWLVAHYDRAELNSLALAGYLALGEFWAKEARELGRAMPRAAVAAFGAAEAHAHQSLSALRDHMQRSRGISTARLARAQLGQGDLDEAVRTAMTIPAGQRNHPRTAGMISAFGRDLSRQAGVRDWRVGQWEQHLNDRERPAL